MLTALLLPSCLPCMLLFQQHISTGLQFTFTEYFAFERNSSSHQFLFAVDNGKISICLTAVLPAVFPCFFLGREEIAFAPKRHPSYWAVCERQKENETIAFNMQEGTDSPKPSVQFLLLTNLLVLPDWNWNLHSKEKYKGSVKLNTGDQLEETSLAVKGNMGPATLSFFPKTLLLSFLATTARQVLSRNC